MGTRYDWAGSRIMPYPILNAKRRDDPTISNKILIDMRDFIMPPNRREMIEVLNITTPNLPKKVGTFDQRARSCWEFMIGKAPATGVSKKEATPEEGPPSNMAGPVTYTPDPKRNGSYNSDFWQFTPETLARGAGDCEDMAILLASLLIGTDISPYCVRVVIGRYSRTVDGKATGIRAHAWVVYKTEQGPWCLIDPTWDSSMFLSSGWHFADGCDDGFEDPRHPGVRRHYVPSYGFNCEHAWDIYSLGPEPC